MANFKKEQNMKLTYRGTTYESDIPTVDVTEGEVGGKYRGQNWSYRYPRHIPVPGPPRNLKYRGVSLTKGETTTGSAVAIAQITEKFAPLQPQSVESSIGKNNIGPIHRANLCKILDRRKQAAREQGNEELLKQLEDESQYLVCC